MGSQAYPSTDPLETLGKVLVVAALLILGSFVIYFLSKKHPD
ncbi:MAG: hypothetical protein WCT08_05030 [Patescibacteria group bacterium]